MKRSFRSMLRSIFMRSLYFLTSNISSIIIFCVSISFLGYFGKELHNNNKLFNLYSKKHEYEELDTKEKSQEKPFLNGKNQSFKLYKIIKLTPTVKIFIFSYPHEYEYLGLGICKHIKFNASNIEGKIKGKWNNNDDKEKNLKQISRSYTPVYIDKQKKHVHFIIRVYYPDDEYIDGGKMSIQLNKLNNNDEIDINGPFGLLEYKGNNELLHLSKSVKIKKHIVMIAGGTGMTPFFRLINHLLLTKEKELPSDPVYITFIYANRNENEILLKSIFDDYENRFENFKRVYSVDKCLNTNQMSNFENIGFINEELLRKYVLKYEKLNIEVKSKDTLILLCGPPPMTSSVKSILKDQLHMENIIVF
ncbi:NADH-cytochrome b5 reductase, putative [Plasmodium reichenowi]|uniref:NADH-cytochrome b5 reductase, putative n=1 Tax=Plasmodium reichenowi TaxID=5854 RepID=A0A151L812_PLARE|nr:NADH-cytochrome b5 reductase, putative [Plasmodium reichenowi]KYN95082.1 NADH-cytochrome b5 reductase, putative [Plasmodium reichenowi]